MRLVVSFSGPYTRTSHVSPLCPMTHAQFHRVVCNQNPWPAPTWPMIQHPQAHAMPSNLEPCFYRGSRPLSAAIGRGAPLRAVVSGARAVAVYLTKPPWRKQGRNVKRSPPLADGPLHGHQVRFRREVCTLQFNPGRQVVCVCLPQYVVHLWCVCEESEVQTTRA